jgi:hypothetical protein
MRKSDYRKTISFLDCYGSAATSARLSLSKFACQTVELSVEVKTIRLPLLLDGLLVKNDLAAATSRLARGMKATVWPGRIHRPIEVTHLPRIFRYVSSTRHDCPVDVLKRLQSLTKSGV